jgi:phage terminase small subunit
VLAQVNAHPELHGKSIADQKTIVKANPAILAHAKALTNVAI